MRVTRRSVCPVACSLDLLGDKWTLLVVRDLMCGRTQFSEFARSPERIATNTLSDRLDRLVTHGLVERDGSAYRLTAAGLALRPVLDALVAWGLAHLKGTAARLSTKSGSGSDPSVR